MDKSWISIEDRWTDDAFRRGLENFLEFAYTNKPAETKIKCPCTKCRNSRLHSKEDVKYHVMRSGFLQGYTNWVHQGEQPNFLKKNPLNASQSHERNEYHDMDGLIHDTLLASHHHGEFNEQISCQQNETDFNNKSMTWTGANVDSVVVVDAVGEDNVDNSDDEDDEAEYFSSDNSDSNDDDDFFEDTIPSYDNETD